MNPLQIREVMWFQRQIFGLTVALFVGWSMMAGAPALAATKTGFTLSVSPASATIQAGSSQRLTLTVTSTEGFAGTVNVGVKNVSPSVTNGPTFSLSRYDIAVSQTMPTSTARLTAFTTTGTPAGTYTVTVSGKDISGGSQYGLTNSTSFTITVSP
jgi:hypothetical protein